MNRQRFRTAAAAREAIRAELAKLGYDGKVTWNGDEATASVGWGTVLSARGKVTDEAVTSSKKYVITEASISYTVQ